MTDKDKAQLIEIYGADPARWPADLRGKAPAILNSSPDAAQRANTLDAALDSHRVSPPSDLLRARILKAARADTPAIIMRPAWHQRKFVRLGAIAAIFVMAITVSFQTLTPVPLDDSALWLEAANDLGIEDLYSWVEDDAG